MELTQSQIDADAYRQAREKRHAPGPWELILLVADDGSRYPAIKSTRTGGVVGYPAGGSHGETEGNAALQVLAPRMLEAIQHMLDNAFEHKWHGDEQAFNMLSRIVAAAKVT